MPRGASASDVSGSAASPGLPGAGEAEPGHGVVEVRRVPVGSRGGKSRSTVWFGATYPESMEETAGSNGKHERQTNGHERDGHDWNNLNRQQRNGNLPRDVVLLPRLSPSARTDTYSGPCQRPVSNQTGHLLPEAAEPGVPSRPSHCNKMSTLKQSRCLHSRPLTAMSLQLLSDRGSGCGTRRTRLGKKFDVVQAADAA